jgi:hypothetical protein
MPKMNFCFQGWVNGANIIEATDVDGKKVNVSKMNPEELADKLNKGELFISLGDYLYSNRKSNIEMFDFDCELELKDLLKRK